MEEIITRAATVDKHPVANQAVMTQKVVMRTMRIIMRKQGKQHNIENTFHFMQPVEVSNPKIHID